MTREIFNQMFDHYASIIKGYSYSTLYNICWNGKLGSKLGDNCKVTYCGYSVINFTNGYFMYTIYNYDGKWKLKDRVDAIAEVADNKCQVTFYRSKEWDNDTIGKYYKCYTYYPYKCKDEYFYYKISDVIYQEIEEDNHNACLLALKYGISLDKAREYTYGKK